MTSLDDLRPSPPVAGLRLERVAADSPLIPDVLARIGAPHGWRSASRTPPEWAEWLSHPWRQYWLIMEGARVAGITDIEPHPGGDVEITTFGLLPEFVGKGLGGYALTLAIAQAWRTEPLEAGAVRRVWLHTSTKDHPNALPNYTRRGLRPYRTETVSPDGSPGVSPGGPA
ncbi:N-acetyltransferase [Sphaerisporangium krabiense]|uniref:GNAT superfamily N-acetyltransferase n=1 Tax=Sphaerisporangium krabiense TaxID=763782 RepID=A0A7W8Z6P7_9ACTN|nr:GNAT family N-acetyltransferase [Sphaerisporangium krabiense]MBB5628230.1 GNAT superfamily N-acetyltransferase [Sphaerisporangium krabiense]GII66225.1 N-acetyltransferase [Sphaerisporangium krabiense]